MKFNFGLGLVFASGTFAAMVPGDCTCWAQKCAAKCEPKDGGRDGTVIGTTIHHGDNWCYMQSQLRDTPTKCDPTIGCDPPPKSQLACVTKDYDEGQGGCSSENS